MKVKVVLTMNGLGHYVIREVTPNKKRFILAVDISIANAILDMKEQIACDLGISPKDVKLTIEEDV